MKSAYLALLISASLAACGSEAPATTDTEQEPGASAAVTGANATDAATAQQDFALDFTPYPGADLESYMSAMGQTMALFRSSDSAEAIMSHYRDQAVEQGFEITVDEVDGPVHNINAERSDGASLVITVTDEGQERLGDISISS
ncbi:hypothetical protein [Henriciella sp.]|uniref:hypothetical protein n=1 Tax=Henriciella sp. TaxID=1968823 RepID=UPI00262DEFD1|nr:hypothetical protein [Henriciella sp.]